MLWFQVGHAWNYPRILPRSHLPVRFRKGTHLCRRQVFCVQRHTAAVGQRQQLSVVKDVGTLPARTRQGGQGSVHAVHAVAGGNIGQHGQACRLAGRSCSRMLGCADHSARAVLRHTRVPPERSRHDCLHVAIVQHCSGKGGATAGPVTTTRHAREGSGLACLTAGAQRPAGRRACLHMVGIPRGRVYGAAREGHSSSTALFQGVPCWPCTVGACCWRRRTQARTTAAAAAAPGPASCTRARGAAACSTMDVRLERLDGAQPEEG